MKHSPVILPVLLVTLAAAENGRPIPVTPDNFIRAESDLYMSAVVQKGGFGRFDKVRDLAPVERQTSTHANRDTLYAAAVFDLDAGPVTITLPDPGKRFMSMQVITEDQYTPMVVYRPGSVTLTREEMGTRYVLTPLRIMVNGSDPKDLAKARTVQDAVKVSQTSPGRFEIPSWDTDSRDKVRQGLLLLADTLPDMSGMFGAPGEVDPVRRLIGAAAAWGGNPERDATSFSVVPAENDGKTVHRLLLKNVPVDGFWSISVYNDRGVFEPNPQGAYTVNSITAKPAKDGTVQVQFGGCGPKTANCIPIPAGWSYVVRLYRPRPEVLNGSWHFPIAEPAG